MPPTCLTIAYRRLSCDSPTPPESPDFGNSRPTSMANALDRRAGGHWGDRFSLAQLAQPVRPSPTPHPPGLRPLKLVEKHKALREMALTGGSVPMQREPVRLPVVRPPPVAPAYQPSPGGWEPWQAGPPPQPVRLPSPVPLLQPSPLTPGMVLFEAEPDVLPEMAYDGCTFEMGPVRTQYDVTSPTGRPGLGRRNTPRRPLPRPPPPTGPLPDLPPLPPAVVPPPRYSSLAGPHRLAMAELDAQGHPLPGLVRAAERGHPLSVSPGVVNGLRAQSAQRGPASMAGA